MNLGQALAGCSTVALRKIAARRRHPVDVTTTRAELIAVLAADLTAASNDGRLWSDLSRHEQVAWQLVAGSGGRHGGSLLERRLRARFDWQDDGEAAEILLGRLVECGILFKVFESGDGGANTAYVLPDEYSDASQADAGPIQSTERAIPLEPVDISRNDPAKDLFLLASALRREAWNAPVRLLRGRRARSSSALLRALRADVPDPIGRDPLRRWRFLSRLGVYMGWLQRGPLAVPDDNAVEALLRDRSGLPSRLWRAYAAMPGPVDRGEVPLAVGRDVVQILAALPEGQWVDVPELHQTIQKEPGPGPSEDPGATSRFAAWLSGPLFWLGLVAWGTDDGGWSLVQATPDLRVAAGRSTASIERAAGRRVACTLSDELSMVAPDGVDLAALYCAEPYLEYAGGGSCRRYRLTAASVARGLRLGGSADRARQTLEELSDGPLSDVWVSALDAARGGMALRLEAGVLLRANGGEAMRRALDVSEVRGAVGERLSDQAVLVDSHRLGSLLEGLANAGQAVEIGAGLKLESRNSLRAAGIGGTAAETLWLLLRAIEAVDRSVLDSLPNARSTLTSLDFVLPAGLRRRLERQVAGLASRIRSPGRRARR